MFQKKWQKISIILSLLVVIVIYSINFAYAGNNCYKNPKYCNLTVVDNSPLAKNCQVPIDDTGIWEGCGSEADTTGHAENCQVPIDDTGVWEGCQEDEETNSEDSSYIPLEENTKDSSYIPQNYENTSVIYMDSDSDEYVANNMAKINRSVVRTSNYLGAYAQAKIKSDVNKVENCQIPIDDTGIWEGCP